MTPVQYLRDLMISINFYSNLVCQSSSHDSCFLFASHGTLISHQLTLRLSASLALCEDLVPGTPSGVFTLTAGIFNVEVFCDMDTDGGGWTQFYTRVDGSRSFAFSTMAYWLFGIGEPNEPEFLIAIDFIKSMINASGLEHTLLVEMQKDNERAFARYDGLTFFPSGLLGEYLEVLYYDPLSTAGAGLTIESQEASGCDDIVPPVYTPNKCHYSNSFGEYGNTLYGEGINWGPWLGMEISLDAITMKVRPTHCATRDAAGICTACETGYEFVIDGESGRENCLSTVTPLTCGAGLVLEVATSSCLSPSQCDIDEGKILNSRACLECDPSCPSRCKGPLPTDCVFESCQEMEQFYPSLSGSTFYAVLHLNGALTETFCRPDGWF